jgi:hypothetical protein
MRSKVSAGAALILALATAAGCSSTTGSRPEAVGQPTSAIAGPSSSTASTDSATTPSSTPAATTKASTAQAKPVSVLLAKISGPVTTTNMPKAQTAWISAVQKTMDDGKPIADHGGISTNLVALVDEAAKTSDLDALIKLCASCSDPAQKDALTQAMVKKDSSGKTGFAQLSFLLEHTHPAQPYSQSGGGEFPGFASGLYALPPADENHAALTAVDRTDMKALGVSSIADYKGVKVTFEDLNDGPDGYDGWLGLATDA